MVPPSKIVVGDKATREDANMQQEVLVLLVDDDTAIVGSLPGFCTLSMETRGDGSIK
jgi:hypothetical protein